MHRILVTRAPHQASALADALRALGAEPILVPTIEITEPTTYAPLDEAIHFLLKTAENHQLCPWNVLVFTSANAVVAFGRRLLKIYEAAHPNPTLIQPENPKENPWGFLAPATEDNLPSQAYFRAILTGGPTIEHGLAHLISDGFTKDGSLAASMSRDRGMPFKVASIGPATGHALNLLSIYPDFGPRQSVAESLAETLLEEAFPANQPPPRFLLIRAEEARDVLPDALRKAGAEVTIVPAYRTVTPDGAADSLARLFASPETRPHAITFTSSSSARNFFNLAELAGVDLHSRLRQITIHHDAEGNFYDNMEFDHPPIFASIGPITTATLKDLKYYASIESPQATVVSLAETVVSFLDSNNRP